MAGTPRKRQKREAEAQSAFGAPAPVAVDNVRPLVPSTVGRSLGSGAGGNAHARAPARDAHSLFAPTRAAQPGLHTKQFVDESTRATLDQLASALTHTMQVRIARTRPSWASGILEDTTVDSGSLAELIEYIREEHGGQKYKLTALAPDGTVLMVSELDVAGPPRKDGVVTSRSYWTGDDTAEQRVHRQNNPPPQPAVDLASLIDSIGKLMPKHAPAGDDARIARLERLVERIAERPAQVAAPASSEPFAGIEKAVEAIGHLGKLRKQLDKATGGDAKPAAEAEQDDRGMMQRVIESASVQLLQQGLQNDMTRSRNGGGQPPTPAAPQPSRMIRRAVTSK